MFNIIVVKRNIYQNLACPMSKKSKSKSNKKEPKTEPLQPINLDKSNNIIINVLAKPGAKQNAITDISCEGVGIQINAPPSEGEANTELIKYIASVLNLRKSDVILDRGFKSRNKTLRILGDQSLDEIKKKITNEIDNNR